LTSVKKNTEKQTPKKDAGIVSGKEAPRLWAMCLRAGSGCAGGKSLLRSGTRAFRACSAVQVARNTEVV